MSASTISASVAIQAAKYSESTEIQVTKASVKSESKKEVEKKENSQSSDAQNEREVRLLVPTAGEAWTKAELWKYQKVALLILRATLLKSFLERTIKNFTEKTWKKIEEVSVWEMQTFGDMEVVALTIINASDKPMEAKERTHNNMKRLFKIYAEDGYTKLIELMQSIKRED